MKIYEIFKWIYSLEEGKELLIIEETSSFQIKGIVQKTSFGLDFSLPMINESSKLLYNKNSFFSVQDDLFKIKIKHFIAGNTNLITQKADCKAYILESENFDENRNRFFKYFSKISSIFLINFLDGNKKDLFVKINNFNFIISTCNILPDIKHTFLCIECEEEIDFIKFKHFINNIFTAISFLTGEFKNSEELFFQCELKDFSIDSDFLYRSSEKKYSFPIPFSKFPNNWNWKLEQSLNETLEKKYSSTINELTFTKLVNLIIEKPKVYFSIRIIFDFYNYPIISRVSLMFVVLEALCEELNMKSEFVLKEIKKDIARERLIEIKDKISLDDYIFFEDLIENIDSRLTNNVVNFEQTFISLGIKISNEDKNLFKKRNDIFHGRIIPNKFQNESEEQFEVLEKEYRYYSFRLYVLSSKLILKSLGFDGHIINYPKMFEDDCDITVNEPYFLKLN